MSTQHIVRIRVIQAGNVLVDHEYYPYTKYDEPWTEIEETANDTLIETTYIDEY